MDNTEHLPILETGILQQSGINDLLKIIADSFQRVMDTVNLPLKEQQECSDIFHKLKLVCVPVAKDSTPTPTTLTSLKNVLQTVDSKYLPVFQEYVLFPLRMQLSKYSSICEKTFNLVIECIVLVISRAPVTKISLHSELFNSLCQVLASPRHSSVAGGMLTEEVTLATIHALDAVIRHCDSSVSRELYSPNFLPALGHAVSLLLSFIENGVSKDIRLGATCALKSLLQSHACGGVLLLVGDRFATFLPGASMTFCRVITKQSNQSHSVIVEVLDCWAELLVCVLSDSQLETCSQRSQKHDCLDDTRVASLLVTRDSQWTKSSGQKLMILVSQLASLTTHGHWRVREAVVRFSATVLTHCIKSLSECVNSLLEILVAGCHDEYPEVAKISQKALKDFRQSRDARPLQELLEENVYKVVIGLPRQIRIGGDGDILLSLRLLHNYLDLLGADVSRILMSSVHLSYLLMSLVQALEVDCCQTNTIQESHIHPVKTLFENETATLHQPMRQYCHFKDDRIETCLYGICKTLGIHGDPYILIDDLTNKLSHLPCSTNPHVTGILLTLNNIISSFAERSDSNQDVVRGVVLLYVEALCSPDTMSVTPSVMQLNINVIKTCLYLEGIAVCTKVFAGQLERFFMKVLHPTLYYLGHGNLSISTAAYLTLKQFCHIASYQDIPELLQANADYLINSLSLRMRHTSQLAEVTRVLCITLEFASSCILPLLHSIIHEILLGLDSTHEENYMDFVTVLHQLVSSISRWFSQGEQPTREEEKKVDVNDISERVALFIEGHNNDWVRAHQLEDCDVEHELQPPPTDDSIDENTNTQEKDKPPQHIELIKEVLTRTKHLMSLETMQVSLMVLDTISLASSVFSQHKDQLLPLVHQFWEPLVLKFSDKNIPVVIKAFETLLSLSKVCGDFLTHRTTTRVIPRLTDYLYQYCSHSSGCPSHYHLRLSYKLQLSLLSHLGSLCTWLLVSEQQASMVIDACTPYLNKNQPVTLQEACMTTLRHLAVIYPDIVWLSLVPLGVAAHLEQPSSSGLKQLSIIKFPHENPDYLDNVMQLLDECR